MVRLIQAAVNAGDGADSIRRPWRPVWSNVATTSKAIMLRFKRVIPYAAP
jgi:hypothetical protein